MAEGGSNTLIIGYGSDLHRDDRAGRLVADAIESRALDDVTVRTATQLVPELAEPIADSSRVVFVDASVTAREVAVQPVSPRTTVAGSHHASPSDLLGLVSALGRSCPPAFLVEVPALDLSLGEGLTSETSAAVDRAVHEVIELILSPPSAG